MKTFSIITAVYNGEKFVENCIKAILNTNYDLNLIEHIIVDDGSTDNTKKICEEYAKKYSHIKFYSKPNGNWGSVINFVKNNKLASNDYIVVCDADDMLVKTAFRTINEKCKDEDLFASSFYLWNGKSKKIKITPYFFLFKKHFVKKDLWNYHSSLIIPASGWIKKEIFYSIPDLKEKVSYQDTVLFTHAFLKAKKSFEKQWKNINKQYATEEKDAKEKADEDQVADGKKENVGASACGIQPA